jgi:zinc protease
MVLPRGSMKTEQLQRVRYPNGFEFVFVPSHSAPVLALDLWVRTGSASEEEGEAGLAHVIEHMLFKGTERRPAGAVAREVESLGGDINAYTSFDHTVYTLVLASRYADQGLDLLSDALFHSSFDPEELEREKKVILEEIRRSRDLPQHCLSRLLFSSAYSVHPYGRPVIGDAESVSSFSRKDCLSFLRRWYRPASMTLVAAGDAAFEGLEAGVSRYFGGRRGSGRRPSVPRRPKEPAPSGFRGSFEGREVTDAYFDLAFPAPTARHRDVPALDLLAAILGQGEFSRLQHRIKLDQNLVRTVGAGFYAPQDPGLLYVGGVAEPVQFRRAYQAICQELFRLTREPVGRSELAKARENLEADFIYQKETVQGQAQKAGFFEVVLGDARREEAYLHALRRTGAEDIREAARKYLQSRSAVLAVIHPAEDAPCSPEEAKRVLEDAEKDAARVRRTPHRRRDPLSRTVLPNGARICVKRNPDVPVVAVRAAFLGGSRREARDEAGAFHLASNCLVRGTRSRNVFEIAQACDAFSGQIDGFSGRNSFGVKAEFLSKYLEDGLDLFAEVLCYPSLPEEEVEKVREDTLGAIRLRKDNPAAFTFRLFEETLYGEHPFGWDVLGLPEAVEKLPRETLQRLLEQHRRPEDLCVAVAGDVDPDLVHEFFAHSLEHLERGPSDGWTPLTPTPPPRRRWVAAEAPFEQVHVVGGFLGATIPSAERFALRVANSILTGQGGRLFRILRDEKGLAYAVSSACVEGLDRGYVAAYLATHPENAQSARDGIFAEFARLCAGDLSPEELEEAKRKLVGGFEITLQENAFQAAQMALDEIYGLGFRNYTDYAGAVFAVERDQVINVARRYFDPERSVSVIVGQGAEDRV